MAQTSIIDLDALTAPIPGDNPRGQYLGPDKQRQLADWRKDYEPNPDNPSGAPVPKKPEWGRLVRTTSEWLEKSSKDLRVAVHLVEALTRLEGFAGLREGLLLLQRLFSDCWDRMYPVIEEEGDLETRAGMLLWLNNPDGGALFPNTIHALPLFHVRNQTINFRDWQEGNVGGTPIDRNALGGAKPDKPELAQAIADCLVELGKLEELLAEKLQHHAPVLIGIRQALEDCQRLLAHAMPTASAAAPAGAAASIGATAEANNADGTSTPRQRGSRDDIYRQMTLLAHQLADIEPHSPIPDLLLWAVELGKKPFRELIKELVREEGVLAEIRRNFGIKEESTSSEE